MQSVRMAERSKALRSGRSPLLWAWVRIPLLTRNLLDGLVVPSNFLSSSTDSRVAQWKRAGPITQRSVDRNYALLKFLVWWNYFSTHFISVRMAEWSKAPDSRHSLASLIGSVVRILVLVWGRGFKSHFWQNFWFISLQAIAKCLQHRVFPGGHPSKY